MTNATKTLTVIFVGLLVLTGLVKWLGGSTSSQAFRTDLVNVDTSRVDRVVIESATGNRVITLNRQGPGWAVTSGKSGESYPADADKVKRALQQLNDLNVQAVATRDPRKYTRYKADSTGTLVTLYSGDTRLSGIYLGAPQIQGRRDFNSYVRPVEDEAVYTVEGFPGSTYNRDLEGWRDKVVWEADREAINRIDFIFPADSSYSIERAGSNSWISGVDTLRAGPVSTITSRLGTLRASGFVDTVSVKNFGPELYAIQLQLEGGEQKTLRLKLPGGDADIFHATASGFPFVFTLNKSSFQSAVLKPREALLRE